MASEYTPPFSPGGYIWIICAKPRNRSLGYQNSRIGPRKCSRKFYRLRGVLLPGIVPRTMPILKILGLVLRGTDGGVV